MNAISLTFHYSGYDWICNNEYGRMYLCWKGLADFIPITYRDKRSVNIVIINSNVTPINGWYKGCLGVDGFGPWFREEHGLKTSLVDTSGMLNLIEAMETTNPSMEFVFKIEPV